MIALHEPQIDEQDIASVVAVLKSSWISTASGVVSEFEQQFANYLGQSEALAVQNATLGLHLIIETLSRQRSLKPGGFDVIVPAISFVASANAVLHARGNPKFVDVEPGKMNIEASSVRQFVEQHYIFDSTAQLWKSRSNGSVLLAIMVVHVMGECVAMAEFADISSKLGIPIIEDAAEALGSVDSSGRPPGFYSTAAAFSFNGNKIITSGGGGMIVSNDKALMRRMRHLSTTARTNDVSFEHDEPAFNYRMTGLTAALGLSQLKKVPKFLEIKREILKKYQLHFANGAHLEVFAPNPERSNNWLVNVLFRDSGLKDQALSALHARGIQARPLWTPLPFLQAMSKTTQMVKDFPNAASTWNRVLSLPSSPSLTLEEIALVTETIKSALRVAA